MLYVASPDFAQLRTNYLKAKDALDLAHKSYTRSQDLYQHHVIAQADLEQAESTENQAQADLQAAEAGIEGGGNRTPRQHVERRHDAGGSRARSDCRRGRGKAGFARPGDPGGRHADLYDFQPGEAFGFLSAFTSVTWATVHVGDAVSIQTDAYPEEFHGRISYIGAALDPTSHTLPVRIITQNPGEKLKKDMYVTATIQAGAISNAMTVPDSAVLRDAENEPFVYVEVSPNQFGQRQVTIGENADGNTQVLSGLQSGERDHCRRQLVLAVPEFIPTLMKGFGTSDLGLRTSQYDSSHRPIRFTPAISDPDVDRHDDRAGGCGLSPHAGGCVSRSFPAHGGDHHAMAGPRGGGGGAPGHVCPPKWK